MASQNWSSSSAGSLILQLPPPLLVLIQQHLSLAEQLNECTHLCKPFPSPSAATIRYSPPLLLTDESVHRISHSHRLLDVLANFTCVELRLHTVPRLSRALQFLVSSPHVDLLFPSLASFSVRLSVNVVVDESARMQAIHADDGVRDDPMSLLPLLPFLSARHTTLHSLHIQHPSSVTVNVELTALLTPLTSLRRLYLAAALSMANVTQLLKLPLEVLDMHDSELSCTADTSALLPPLNSIAGCELLQSCRVLRLPRSWVMTQPGWLACLDAIATQRSSNTRPHTLSTQHRLSAAAVEQLIDSPPSHSLAVGVSLANGPTDLFLSHAATPLSFITAPRQLHLSIHCKHWNSRSALQPFIGCVQYHQLQLRSFTLNLLPRSNEATCELLAAISQCPTLELLHLSTAGTPNRSYNSDGQSTAAVRWSGQPHLSRLHTLTLVGLREAEATVCHLLSACPSLQLCSLDLLGLSVSMLRTLASSCPLLSLLKLRISDESVLATTATTEQELSQPAAANRFRSLVQLDLHYTAWSRTRPWDFPSVMSKLNLFLAGSPLRQFSLLMRFEVQYQTAVQSLLLVAVSRLERLRVASGDWEPVAGAPGRTMTSGWDEGQADEKVDEVRAAQHASVTPTHTSAEAVSSPESRLVPPTSSSSLDSLNVLVSPASLPVDHFASLVSVTPAVTSIALTVRSPDGGLLLTFLHCLAHIGRHCPLIQHITFALDVSSPPTPANVRVLSADEVSGVIGQYDMPENAFTRLRYVCEVGAVVEVMSEEAAGYVRRRWLSNVRGVAILDCHTQPQTQ